MERYDVVVMGIDPALGRDGVIQAVAQHLSTGAREIEQLLDAAPAVLVEGVTELEARRLVTDLRQLGARVKPRAQGAELPVAASSRSSSSSLAPRQAPARAPMDAIELSSLPPSEATGLELDLPLPAPRAPSVAPVSLETEPVFAPTRTRPPPVSSARPPADDAARELPEKLERPRAFWTALPEAFLVPFRGHAIYGLLGAPFLAVAAMLSVGVGMRMSMMAAVVGLVFMFGFVGTMLQVSRRCLWATAVGERVPDPLPTDLMSEYMFTGVGVVAAQGAFGGIAAWLSLQLVSRGAPDLLIDGFLIFVGLYGVIGFALSAANGSATGYLDVLRILRILAKAPLHVLMIAFLGALVQGGALVVAGLQLAAAAETGDTGNIFLSLGLVGFLLAFVATYGAALSATMMGMLFYAKPDVAN